jgi:hypothetical protein
MGEADKNDRGVPEIWIGVREFNCIPAGRTTRTSTNHRVPARHRRRSVPGGPSPGAPRLPQRAELLKHNVSGTVAVETRLQDGCGRRTLIPDICGWRSCPPGSPLK